MSAAMNLAEAIAALVSEKRVTGYKYNVEQHVLARFEAFCRAEFPGLDTVSQDAVEAWLTAARVASR